MKSMTALAVFALSTAASLAAGTTESVLLSRDAQGKITAATTIQDEQSFTGAVTIEVKCEAQLPCTKASATVSLAGSVVSAEQGKSDGLKILVPQTEGGSYVVEIKYDGAIIKTAKFNGAKPVAPPARVDTTLANLLAAPCTGSVDVGYDRKNNEATVWVTPTGRVIGSQLEAFDENDSLRVVMFVHPDLAGRIGVRRSSAFRDRTEYHIIGDTVKASDLDRHAGEAYTCQPVVTKLQDFAPGKGVVDITLLDEKGETKVVGTFEFGVDTLYFGGFSIGGAWSENVDPEFDLAGDGSTKYVTAKNQGDHELEYSIFFTPFILGRRDAEKTWEWYRARGERYPWWQHINPSIGLVLDDIADNALAGVTVDLPAGICVTYGAHWRKSTVLDRNSGLEEGSPFTGKDLPTARSWESDQFYAVTIDLRAMVKLLKAAVSGGK